MLWLRVLAVVFTGTAQALIAPPLSWTPLHWIAWVPFLWAIEGQRPRRRFWMGWLCGASALAAIFYWVVGTVQRFSNLPTSLAIVTLILFCLMWGAYAALFALWYPRIKAWSGPLWPLAVAALFVACEFINPQLFPFYQGVAHYQNPALFQVASITGVRGLSFLVLLVNGLAWAAIETLWLKRGPMQSRHLVRLTGVTVLLLAATLIFGAFRLRHIRSLEEDAEVLRVGLVQLDLDIKERARRSRTRKGRLGIFEEYLAESRRAAEQGAQVVMWPEGASPFRVTGKRGQDIAETAREAGIEMWLGGLTTRKDPESGDIRFHNSAFRFDRRGDRDRRYDKIVLLPFGEFMPGRHLFPELTRKIQGVGNFYPGEDVVVFETEWAPFNFLICYEAIRSKLVRRSVEAGSRFFVTITNDAWFGDTSCPHQHLMLTANRCTEYGCPMVRVATTGISAAVDARGIIVAQTEPYTRETLVVDVPLVYAPTLYTRIGDAFSYACLFVAIAGVCWGPVARRLRRGRRDEKPAEAANEACKPGNGGSNTKKGR
jgi:apolipoprotein N-acyltransferase